MILATDVHYTKNTATAAGILIDGFVYLDDAEKLGLGKHLYDALEARIPIVGVAKSAFTSTPAECAILRGESQNPLYVIAIRSKNGSRTDARRIPHAIGVEVGGSGV